MMTNYLISVEEKNMSAESALAPMNIIGPALGELFSLPSCLSCPTLRDGASMRYSLPGRWARTSEERLAFGNSSIRLWQHRWFTSACVLTGPSVSHGSRMLPGTCPITSLDIPSGLICGRLRWGASYSILSSRYGSWQARQLSSRSVRQSLSDQGKRLRRVRLR